MNVNEIPDKRKVFVGVDCRNDNIYLSAVNFYGNFLTGSKTYFPNDTSKLGEIIAYTIKGMRGDGNLRMRNFVGIGISFINSAIEIGDIDREISQMIGVPVYLDNYQKMKKLGEDWITFLSSRTGIPAKSDLSNLYVPYGLVKMIRQKTSKQLNQK